MTSVVPLYVAAQKSFMRDRMALFWTLAFPVLFILLFGVIFSGSGQDPVSVGVVRPRDAGGVPDPVLAALSSIPALEVRTGTRAELMDQLGDGDLRVVVDAPPSLAGDVAGGRAVEVEVIFDPTSASARQVAVPVIGAALGELDGVIRRRPALIDGSRRKRIARGSGVSVEAVNRLLRQFAQMRKMLKTVRGMTGRKRKSKARRGRAGPGTFGLRRMPG